QRVDEDQRLVDRSERDRVRRRVERVEPARPRLALRVGDDDAAGGRAPRLGIALALAAVVVATAAGGEHNGQGAHERYDVLARHRISPLSWAARVEDRSLACSRGG